MAYKTFFETFSLILNNQKGNLDLGSEDSGGSEDAGGEDGGEDLSTEGLLESINLESDDDTGSESSSEDSSNEESSENSSGEKTEGDDLEARLKGLEVDKPEGEESNSVLEELNKLGIIHNGLPVEFEDLEKVKEHLSKGYDYTQKTQELSEARKTFDAEIAQERETFSKEREEFVQEQEQNKHALSNYNVFQSMVADIQANDPELFEELDRHFVNHQNEATKISPQVEKLQNEIQQLREQVSGSVESDEDRKLGEIKQTWEKEVGEVQSGFGPKLRSLGIKPDWSKVQEVWKADASNSLTVKNALFATYGEQIEKAMANKSKIAETRAKVARQGAKPDTGEDDKQMFGMTSGNSYENEAFEILKDL